MCVCAQEVSATGNPHRWLFTPSSFTRPLRTIRRLIYISLACWCLSQVHVCRQSATFALSIQFQLILKLKFVCFFHKWTCCVCKLLYAFVFSKMEYFNAFFHPPRLLFIQRRLEWDKKGREKKCVFVFSNFLHFSGTYFISGWEWIRKYSRLLLKNMNTYPNNIFWMLLSALISLLRPGFPQSHIKPHFFLPHNIIKIIAKRENYRPFG